MMLSFFYLRIITNNNNPIIVDTIVITTRRAGRNGRKCRVPDFGRQTSQLSNEFRLIFLDRNQQLLFNLIDLRSTYPSVCLRTTVYLIRLLQLLRLLGRTTVPLSILSSETINEAGADKTCLARVVYVTVWRVVAAPAAAGSTAFSRHSVGDVVRRAYRGHHTEPPVNSVFGGERLISVTIARTSITIFGDVP